MAFDIDTVTLKKYVTRRGGGAERALQENGQRIVTEAKRLCTNNLVNVDTGRLRAGIDFNVQPDSGSGETLVLHVGTNVEYGEIVHEGRGPIVAPPGKALGPMKIGGRGGLFFKSVGPAAPRPFLTHAIRNTRRG